MDGMCPESDSETEISVQDLNTVISEMKSTITEAIASEHLTAAEVTSAIAAAGLHDPDDGLLSSDNGDGSDDQSSDEDDVGAGEGVRGDDDAAGEGVRGDDDAADSGDGLGISTPHIEALNTTLDAESQADL
jgi:hypothetical protein